MRKKYHIIGACSCWGAQIRACERGPEVLLEQKVFDKLQAEVVNLIYPEKRALDGDLPQEELLTLIHAFNLKLCQAVKNSLKSGAFPIVIGGDHSIAVGTWNAFDPPFGLIWIDAHMDAHTPETTPSGAVHGMPVAALLGHGMKSMSQLIKQTPVLQPQNLAYIGVRSFEPGEKALLESLNVRIYYIDEVKERGLKVILAEAIAHVTRKGVTRYGVSLDLDAFSVEDAPGVGSPEERGIPKSELLPLLSLIGNDPRLMGFELVEFNPERDIHHRTCELVLAILRKICG